MSYSSPRKERPSDILFGSRDTINSPTISIRPATVQFNFFRTSLVFFPAENTAEPIQSTKSRLLRSNEGFIFRTRDSVSNQPVDCTSTYIDNLISHGQASTDAIDSRRRSAHINPGSTSIFYDKKATETLTTNAPL